MAYEIKWTPIAKDNYHEIVSWIYDNWGNNSAEKFTNELQARLQYLERFPFLGKQHLTLSSVRQLIISKHQIHFYTVIENTIIVLNVIDNNIIR